MLDSGSPLISFDSMVDIYNIDMHNLTNDEVEHLDFLLMGRETCSIC